MNWKVRVFLKSVINFMYFVTVVSLVEVLGDVPFLSKAFTINSGNPLDIGLQVIVTIIMFCIVIIIIKLLVKNVLSYASVARKRTPRCSVFNPFC